MRRLVTLLVLSWSLIARGDAPKDQKMVDKQLTEDPGWAAAEAQARAAHKDATAITPRPRLKLRYAFSVTDAKGTRSVLVLDGKVHEGRQGLAFVGRCLKAHSFLEKQPFGEAELIFLLNEFGEVPPEVAEALRNYPMSTGAFPGYEPKLVVGRAGATLTVHAARPRAGPGGADPTPMQRLYRATLQISPRYALKWKVTPMEVPQTGL